MVMRLAEQLDIPMRERNLLLIAAGYAPVFSENTLNDPTLHPDGLAPRVANLVEWRTHLLARLRRQIQVTADPVLSDLMRELSAYSITGSGQAPPAANEAAVAAPFKIHTEAGLLSFFSMTTVFGTPVDITLAELALEFFLPADTANVEAISMMAA